MSFVSLSFLFFLPVVFILYWALAKKLCWQNLLIVIASYVFYGWWDYRFLFLIFITSISSYVSGMAIYKSDSRLLRRGLAVSNIILNIAILACFKYFNFFADNLLLLATAVGVRIDVPTLHLILPVGISFYTFQSLSYTIDVYRGKISATNDAVAFFAYISFFPQLVAGPIERATNLLPQILQPRRFDYPQSVAGLRQILWGFFKKMVVADNCAIAVNMIWNDWQSQSGITLFLGMLLFSFQIYCDFSGYSDIAIGVARLFGIKLSVNFNLPYFSRNISEFWRRWHISLMSWFRDYVYIPLGGSRVSRLKTVRNTFVVFLLSGLWHGANWTFVLWGAYNALLFLPSLLRGAKRANNPALPMGKDTLNILLTFMLVAIGWVIFRSDSIDTAMGYMYRMLTSVSMTDVAHVAAGKTALLWCLFLLVAEWIQLKRRDILQLINSRWALRWGIYYILLFCILFFHGEEQTFIYFQF